MPSDSCCLCTKKQLGWNKPLKLNVVPICCTLLFCCHETELCCTRVQNRHRAKLGGFYSQYYGFQWTENAWGNEFERNWRGHMKGGKKLLLPHAPAVLWSVLPPLLQLPGGSWTRLWAVLAHASVQVGLNSWEELPIHGSNLLCCASHIMYLLDWGFLCPCFQWHLPPSPLPNTFLWGSWMYSLNWFQLCPIVWESLTGTEINIFLVSCLRKWDYLPILELG